MADYRNPHHRPLPARIRIYQANRRRFSLKTYFIALLCIIISVAQWFVFCLITPIRDFMTKQLYIPVIFLLVALICITIFIFTEKARFTVPLNWILGFIILECVALGMVGILMGDHGWMPMLMAICVALALLFVFVLIGMVVPHDFTLDVVVLFLLSIVSFLGAMLFVMLYLLMHASYVVYIFAFLVLIPTTLFTIYHAQTISGGRYGEMRTNDYILAGLIIFSDFVLYFLVMFLIMHNIWCSGIYKSDDQKSCDNTSSNNTKT